MELNLKRWMLVIVVIVIAMTSLGFMNSKYDTLSRYSYSDENARSLIKEYLNKEEIEYIIEYSIEPALFIDYIQEKEFNIYHAAEYRYLSEYLWSEAFGYPTPYSIVDVVEATRGKMDIHQLGKYLEHYPMNEIKNWVQQGDRYSPESFLVMNPSDMTVNLSDMRTVGEYAPFSLEPLNEKVPSTKDKIITVRTTIQGPLIQFCEEIEKDLEKRNCAGLFIEEGYVSYDDQVSRYEEAKIMYGEEVNKFEFYPGHSEHQLGLAVDFSISGKMESEFKETEQYKWIRENAHRFGFIQTYHAGNEKVTNKVENPYHFRYVGKELAQRLYEKNMYLSDIVGN